MIVFKFWRESMDYAIDIFRCRNLPLVKPGTDWFFVCSTCRNPPEYAKEGKLFKVEKRLRGRGGMITQEYTDINLEPNLLGRFAWDGGYNTIAIEVEYFPERERVFNFVVGVTNPNNFRPEIIWDNSVYTGTGEYALVNIQRSNDKWSFHEYLTDPSVIIRGRPKIVLDRWNENLDSCLYPTWLVQQLENEFLPRLERWLKEQEERRAAGFEAPLTHLDLCPDGKQMKSKPLDR